MDNQIYRGLHRDPGTQITLIGAGVNIGLIAVKLTGGILTSSIALIGDGIHSISDLATDLTVLAGIRLGARKADTSHAYGHGRYETLAGGVVALVLIVVGAYIAWDGGMALYNNHVSYPGWAVVVIAAGAIAAKEWIARRTLRIAEAVRSPALHANAWHHRSDALSSVAVLLGGIGGLLGWGHADQVAGMIVGGMVIAAGIRTVGTVVHELLEGSLSRAELRLIQRALEEVPRVRGWHKLRTRRVGRNVFIDLHVLVDPHISVLEGHRISMEVERAIKAAVSQPANVLVHVEPDIPELAAHDADD